MKYYLLTVLIVLLSLIHFSCENNSESDISQKMESPDLFPKEAGKEIIYVSNVPELMATTRLTKDGNKVVVIKDGEYEISAPIRIAGDEIIYRSESANRDRVILKGKGINGSISRIFTISANNFAVKDITIGEVSGNGIKIQGEKDADSIYVQNVRFYDIKSQMVVATYDEDYSGDHADYGTVENCLFELTDSKAQNNQCGGIDIYGGTDWRISNCTFKNLNSSDQKQSTGAIRFRNASKNCIAENNVIVNCDRGILFGFNNEPHSGGIIRNNMISVIRESGIYICNAKDVKVYNNTIYNPSDYPYSIECLDESGRVEIINNLTNKNIDSNDLAIIRIENNITHADESWFKNVSRGNLLLAKNISEVVNSSISLEDGSRNNSDHEILYLADIGANKR
ncbi:right-handed parallel beta-helix repeat-containing protein [Saccharicrinis sp. FJH2]|uniref:right-handed parallel beta-helix repeat-containing protein n=1 Tax=Saccharicrinis sp. FJH65 TaxID=3344659 RepID=UPI0035F370EE